MTRAGTKAPRKRPKICRRATTRARAAGRGTAFFWAPLPCRGRPGSGPCASKKKETTSQKRRPGPFFRFSSLFCFLWPTWLDPSFFCPCARGKTQKGPGETVKKKRMNECLAGAHTLLVFSRPRQRFRLFLFTHTCTYSYNINIFFLFLLGNRGRMGAPATTRETADARAARKESAQRRNQRKQ